MVWRNFSKKMREMRRSLTGSMGPKSEENHVVVAQFNGEDCEGTS
jgi:hypothetical protein